MSEWVCQGCGEDVGSDGGTYGHECKKDQRCPHDGGKCHHGCESDIVCFRRQAGMSLTTPHPGYPKAGFEPSTEPLKRAYPFGRVACWHCGDLLQVDEPQRERCEDCPTECDIEGCEAPGCQDQCEEQTENTQLIATCKVALDQRDTWKQRAEVAEDLLSHPRHCVGCGSKVEATPSGDGFVMHTATKKGSPPMPGCIQKFRKRCHGNLGDTFYGLLYKLRDEAHPDSLNALTADCLEWLTGPELPELYARVTEHAAIVKAARKHAGYCQALVEQASEHTEELRTERDAQKARAKKAEIALEELQIDKGCSDQIIEDMAKKPAPVDAPGLKKPKEPESGFRIWCSYRGTGWTLNDDTVYSDEEEAIYESDHCHAEEIRILPVNEHMTPSGKIEKKP